VPAPLVPDTIPGVYRRLLMLVCFAGLALGMAYVGTGMLENALRAVAPDPAVSATAGSVDTGDAGSTGGVSGSVVGTVTGEPQGGVSSGASGSFEPGFDPAVAADVVLRLNAERLSAGLPPLVFDEGLAGEASLWSEQMTRNGYVHSTQDRLKEISRRFGVGGMAENLHAPEVQCAAAISCNVPEAHPTSGVLHVDWMRSSAHRSTMLGAPWDRVGVGVYCDASGRMWATVLFAAPLNVPVSASDVVPFREPAVAGNDGVVCGGFQRGHNDRWQHTPVS